MSDEEIYEYMGRTFEWDRMKAARNLIKHHVRFPEAATAFFDRDAIVIFDEEHSEDEERFTLIGRSKFTRTLIVAHVVRAEKFRIINARVATKYERRDYESGLGR